MVSRARCMQSVALPCRHRRAEPIHVGGCHVRVFPGVLGNRWSWHITVGWLFCWRDSPPAHQAPANRKEDSVRPACHSSFWRFVTQSTCPVVRAEPGSPSQSGVGAAVPLHQSGQSERSPRTTPAIPPLIHMDNLEVLPRCGCVGCVPATHPPSTLEHPGPWMFPPLDPPKSIPPPRSKRAACISA
jgi:hypothetical protein